MAMAANIPPPPPPQTSTPLVRNRKKPFHEGLKSPVRTMRKFSSLMCGLSPLVKNRKGSELEDEIDCIQGRKRVRFDSRVVYHNLPALDPALKSVLYYSQKEIDGFFTLKKMEQMIHLYTLSRKQSPSLQSPIQDELKEETPSNGNILDSLSSIQFNASAMIDNFFQRDLLRASKMKTITEATA
jgi:hypothetical protein